MQRGENVENKWKHWAEKITIYDEEDDIISNSDCSGSSEETSDCSWSDGGDKEQRKKEQTASIRKSYTDSTQSIIDVIKSSLNNLKNSSGNRRRYSPASLQPGNINVPSTPSSSRSCQGILSNQGEVRVVTGRCTNLH